MTKRIFCLLVSIYLIFLLCACDNTENNRTATVPYSATVFAMDTEMELTVYGNNAVLEKAETLISELEGKFSTTSKESDIYKLNHNGSKAVSADTYALLQSALTLCERTNGALDISVYPIVQAWGFTTGENRVPSESELKALLPLVDYKAIYLGENETVTLAPDMQIDLGSVAKGYTGKMLAELLSENNVTSAVLNLGGNVHALGTKPDGSAWRIGVAAPAGDGYAGAVEVVDKAVITSGGYERFFEQDGIRYHHIINPATGYPADNSLLSVTIIGDDGLVCDALSTALFVMGADKAADFWKESDDFEAIFITSDGICITEGIEATFSPLGDYQDTEVTVLHRN